MDPKKKSWFQMTSAEVITTLAVQPDQGLKSTEARKRLGQIGPNKLLEAPQKSLGKIFLDQFKDFMVLILLVAAAVSGIMGGMVDFITIMAIVLLNAILGFVQEYRAEKSIAALKKLTALEALVLRDGGEVKVPAVDLVPGDLVFLEAGSRVPADLRLIQALNLEIEEATLTGESVPVRKITEELSGESISLGDRRNLAFSGTSVTRGRGQGVVVATGMHTELGQVAGMIQQVETDETPLQRRLDHMGKILVLGCVFLCALVVGLGIWRGESLYLMFLTGVSLAVAAVPEGLPAIVTLVLAVGVQRMIRRKAIVRKLPAVETLGCTTVICSDKTGTLTKNEMTVRKLYLDGQFFEVGGDGYIPEGSFFRGGEVVNPHKQSTLQQFFEIAALCNNAQLEQRFDFKNQGVGKGLLKKATGNAWTVLGDPTEGALLTCAAKGGVSLRKVAKYIQRVAENPFDSERKRMSVVVQKEDGQYYSYVKGAPDVIFERCTQVLIQGRLQPLSKGDRQRLIQVNEALAGEAMRVLGFAYRPLTDLNSVGAEKNEQDLIFVGLVGMIDPPRPAAIRAVASAREAGIRSVMITGDHPATALAIAQEMRIAESGDQVLTGADLEQLSDRELQQYLDRVTVFARVAPSHKVQIVRAFKEKGEIVAMTGDGVNDAPAVKEADIGVAMGKTGTDVTKEASDMVLADDNFSTIVSAIEEGRGIYDNIRKFIRYLLGCNIGEVLTMFLALLMGLPLPLIPIQILWVNLVTDGLPALALGVDQADPDIMNRAPRSAKESIFARGLGKRIILRGVEIALGTLVAFTLTLYFNADNVNALQLAQTTAFCTLVFLQLFYVFECRSEKYTVFDVGITGNIYLILAVVLSMVMQLMVIYLPFFNQVFGTLALGTKEWILILLVAGARQILNLGKYISRRFLGRMFFYWKGKSNFMHNR